jgi:large subunit ribosomal protein L18e
MAKRTGPTNSCLQTLIGSLKKKAIESKEAIWKTIAVDLEKPTRQRRAVNLSRIDRVTKENEIIIVPGKVLGTGALSHPMTIAAWSFSTGAVEKIEKAKAKAITIDDLMKDSAKGKSIRIIG